MTRVIIVITKLIAGRGIQGEDEFMSVWHQRNAQENCAIWQFGNERVLYVYHGCWQRFSQDWNQARQVLRNPQELCCYLKQHIQDDFSKKGLNISQCEVGVLVHPPMDIEEQLMEQFKQKCLGFQPFFVIAIGGHFGIKQVNQKIIEIASTVTSSQTLTDSVFDGWWEFFCGAPSTAAEDPEKRLATLKHRIAHLFLPIDIDLQGLMETGFREDYWREVVDAWKGKKALNILDQARRLLYGTEDDQDTVEKIVEEVKEAIRRISPAAEAINRIDQAWQRVKNQLPPKGEYPDDLQQILTCLERQDKQGLQEKCQGGTNPFHEWFAKLDEALDELREAIEKAQEAVGRGQTSQS